MSRRREIKSAKTTCLLWHQDKYEENISDAWIEKIKTHKTYAYSDEDVRRITSNISQEVTKSFLFWALWSNILNDGYNLQQLATKNLLLWHYVDGGA